MQITDAAAQMLKDGLRHDDHHMKLKAAYRKVTGDDIAGDDLKELQTSMRVQFEEFGVGDPDRAQRTGQAKEPITLKQYHQEHPERTHVVEIVESSPRTGRPTRLLIECQEDGCDATREIAAQDAFQVTRCREHQRQARQRAINERRKQKRQEKQSA